MKTYTTKRHKEPINLTDNQLLFLKLIGNFGFVNANQLNILWSVVQRYPTTFSRAILKQWCSYDGLLKYTPKSHTQKINHAYYVLTNSAKKWLNELGLLALSKETVSVNSHNEQAIESLIQGLYTAVFKYEELGFFHPYLIDKDTFYYASGEEVFANSLADNFNYPTQTYSYTITIPKITQIETLKEALLLLTQHGVKTITKTNLLRATRILRRLLLNGDINVDSLTTALMENGLTIEQSHSLDSTILFPTTSHTSPRIVPTVSRNNNEDKNHFDMHFVFLTQISINNRLFPTFKGTLINFPTSLFWSKDSLKKHKKQTTVVQNKDIFNLQDNLNDLLSDSTSIFKQSFLDKEIDKSSKKINTIYHAFLNFQSIFLKLHDSASFNNKKYLSNSDTLNTFTYYYPRADIKVTANFNNPLDSLEQVAWCFANLIIEKDVLDHLTHSAESYKHSLNLNYRYTTTSVQRGIDLISNPAFNLQDYDFRSFNQQFNIEFAAENKLPFVSDMMVSFKRNNKRHELFIELDNRTEGNKTQIQKILNYIWYARKHPSIKVSMFVALTDGSLNSPKVPQYVNIGRKLGNLSQKLVTTYLPNGESRLYLSQLYQQTPNLDIYLSGVSEVHFDIAHVLLGSNLASEYVGQAKHLEDFLKVKFKSTYRDVSLTLSEDLKLLSHNPIYFLENKDLSKDVLHGELVYTFLLGEKSIKQTLIFGLEHELSSIFKMHDLLNTLQDIDKREYNAPASIYPPRGAKLTAITLSQYKKELSYPNDKFSPTLPFIYQPLFTQKDIQTLKEKRWLLQHYKTPILKDLVSDKEYKSFKNASQKEEYLNSVKVNDISDNVFKDLVTKFPQGIYALPSFTLPEYLKIFKETYNMSIPKEKVTKEVNMYTQIVDKNQIKKELALNLVNKKDKGKPSATYDLSSFIFGLNSTLPFARSKLNF
ncbi:hypothetical protein FP435_00365 (plasmid) [Lactobacillus sp. PV037]|uniref:hypothetical protein n=1 Tax=Lactobacillus sp. PV037 TaxID=2594496 RepID=UPI00223F10A2|nr:hypothetical protein [Lactobacillus sp. PV037]QNQ82990.1 hypothetical protein FP435_00365 [Lactobacillus sp. PV037]